VSIEVEELWIFESCRLSPIRRNSVLEELRDKRLEVNQEVKSQPRSGKSTKKWEVNQKVRSHPRSEKSTKKWEVNQEIRYRFAASDYLQLTLVYAYMYV